jgi:cell division protein FtsL
MGPKYLALFFLVLVLTTSAFAVHLWVRFEGVRLAYATSKARDERASLLLERRELRLELASLKAPARIEAEAREKLGMEVPEHARIIPVGKTPTSLVASGGAR